MGSRKRSQALFLDSNTNHLLAKLHHLFLVVVTHTVFDNFHCSHNRTMSLLELGNTPPTTKQVHSIDKYETTLTVPAEFPAVLKDFAREVLRQQPENIYNFGVEYFDYIIQHGHHNHFTYSKSRAKSGSTHVSRLPPNHPQQQQQPQQPQKPAQQHQQPQQTKAKEAPTAQPAADPKPTRPQSAHSSTQTPAPKQPQQQQQQQPQVQPAQPAAPSRTSSSASSSASSAPFNIFVKNIKGSTLTLETTASETIEVLKRKIEEREWLPPHQQRLVFAGSLLADSNKTLGEYGIEKESVLHLIYSEGSAPQVCCFTSVLLLQPVLSSLRQ